MAYDESMQTLSEKFSSDTAITQVENKAVMRKNITILQSIWSIIKEAWPFVLSRLFIMGDNYITVLIMSAHSKEFLNAAPLIISGQLLLASSVVGVVYSTAIATGMRVGAGRRKTTGKVFQAGLVLSAVLSVPVMIIAGFAKPIYVAIGQDPQLSALAQQYFFGFIAGVPAFLAYTSCQQFLIGEGGREPIVVLLSTILNTAVVGALGYLFINGGFIFPSAGMYGFGAAYSITHWFSFALLLIYIFTRPKFKQHRVIRKTKLKSLLRYIFELLKLGLPIGLQVTAELLTVEMITIYSGWLGKENLIANIVAEQYLSIFIVLVFGYAQTVGTLVSREHGANHPANARKIGNIGLIFGVLCSFLIAALFSFASGPLTYLVKGKYTITQTLKITIRNIMRINGVGEIGDYTRNIATGALRGFYITKIPMASSITTMCILAIPASYLLGFVADFGMEGVYSGRALGMILGGIIMLLLWLGVSNYKVYRPYFTRKERVVEVSPPSSLSTAPESSALLAGPRTSRGSSYVSSHLYAFAGYVKSFVYSPPVEEPVSALEMDSGRPP